MSEDPPPPSPTDSRVSVACRTFRGPAPTAVLALTAGWLSVLVTALGVGLPLALAAPLALLLFAVGLGVLVGDATYTLDSAGLTRVWRPLGARWPLVRRFVEPGPRERTVRWSDVRAYLPRRDLSRGLREVETLEVDVEGPRARWVITDRQDPAGFAVFRAAFLDRAAPAAASPARPQASSAPPPQRRLDFYERWYAHVLAGVALACTLGLMLLAAGGVLGASHLLRLGFVVVPGTLYLVWRTWLRG